jgi:hypothetical protein
MHHLKLTAAQVAAIRSTLEALKNGEGAEWNDQQVHAFSLRVELAVERALRATHPQATDAEIGLATAGHWTDILDDVCEVWSSRVGSRRERL